MSGRVAGKVALVTGAASGIGRASAVLLAAEGAKVACADINAAGAEAVAAEITAAQGAGSAIAQAFDVTDEAGWQQALQATMDAFGRLDVLVNSAGMAHLASVEEETLEAWRRLQVVNVDSVFLGCKHAIAHMAKSGAKDGGGGSIINLSSVSGLVGGHNVAAYNASKGAVRLLSKSVALHCARQGAGVRCNSIHPAFIETPMVDQMIAGAPDPARTRERLVRQIPLGRLGTAADVAWAVLYLASDESSFVTGTELVVDGGLTAA
jgi:3(or 17)beta-hydroxysteroid dehydrogenase